MPRLSASTFNQAGTNNLDDAKLAPLFSEELSKSSQNRLYHLITLFIKDPKTGDIVDFNIADSNYNITYTVQGGQPVTYAAFPVKYAGASINSDGTIDKASITVANVSREIMDRVEATRGLQGCRVAIKAVYENFLDFIYTPNLDGGATASNNDAGKNGTAYIEEEYIIETYQATEQVINFSLDPVIDLEIRLPRRRFMVDTCYWMYKEPHTCKYAGGEAIVGNVTVTKDSNLFKVNFYQGVLWQASAGATFYFDGNPAQKFTVDSFTLIGSNGVTSNRGSSFTGLVSAAVAINSASGILTAQSPISFTGNVILDALSDNKCEKTLAACRLRKNELNFGGFPGISGTRKVYL